MCDELGLLPSPMLAANLPLFGVVSSYSSSHLSLMQGRYLKFVILRPLQVPFHSHTHVTLSVCFRVSLPPRGPFTNDVSREGEGGGWPISDERMGGCMDLVLTRGGGGPKSQKFS